MRLPLKIGIGLVAAALLYAGATTYLASARGMPLGDVDAFMATMKTVVIAAIAMTVGMGVLSWLLFGGRSSGPA